MWGVDFRVRISPRIRSQNRNGLKGSVRDLGQSDLCKNMEKTAMSLSDHKLSVNIPALKTELRSVLCTNHGFPGVLQSAFLLTAE
jgi:hypothetical protein